MAVEVSFRDNLDQVLDQLTTAKARALAVIGATVQEDAVKNSPKRTGALQQSWTVDVDEGDSSVSIGVPVDALDGNYAKFVENGTSKMAPHHMLRTAVVSNIGKFPGIVQSEMKSASF